VAAFMAASIISTSLPLSPPKKATKLLVSAAIKRSLFLAAQCHEVDAEAHLSAEGAQSLQGLSLTHQL